MFSRKSGLVPGFTTILKCTSEPLIYTRVSMTWIHVCR